MIVSLHFSLLKWFFSQQLYLLNLIIQNVCLFSPMAYMYTRLKLYGAVFFIFYFFNCSNNVILYYLNEIVVGIRTHFTVCKIYVD